MFTRTKEEEKEVKEEPKADTLTRKNPETPNIDLFDRACSAGRKLFVERNNQYGNSIEATGVLGASVELIGLSARLRELVLKTSSHGEANKDVLLDVMKDIHNYSNIAMAMISKNNWDGS